MSSKLDDAISMLGGLFGVWSKDKFMQLLLSADEQMSLGEAGYFEIPEPSIDAKIAALVLSVSEGGMTTPKILSSMSEFLKDADPATKKQVGSLICITYEPNATGAAGGEVPGYNSHKSINEFMKTAMDPPQGVGKTHKDVSAEKFSIRDVLGAAAGTEEGSQINKDTDAPERISNPCLSVIQMLHPAVGPATRDTGAITLFLNCMPTIEMSRCVPFLDVIFMFPQPAMAVGGDDEHERVQGMSLGNFLLGAKEVEVGSAEHTYLSSVDAEVSASPPDFGDAQQSDEDGKPGLSTSGLEMFTTPQTLVMADEVHQEWGDLGSGGKDDGTADIPAHPGGPRSAAVIDRFRPFMSLESFSVSVVPSGGMMTYKSAKMSLVLHDRSRLAEVAPLVKPDLFGKGQILIKYGWSHPDNAPHAPSRLPANSTAHFGVFLGSLKCEEKYRVVNSSFSFDEVGQVKIDLTLSMMGGTSFTTQKIANGPGVDEAANEIRALNETMRVIRRKIMRDTKGAGDLGGSNVLSAATSTSAGMRADKETLAAIRKFLRESKRTKNPDVKALREGLTKLFGKKSNGKGGKVSDLNKSIAAEIANKLKLLSSGPDPWLRGISTDKRTFKVNDKKRSWVSLGKIITTFIGPSLAASGDFDDIQLIFYTFNDKSSWMRGRNIAQFPIFIDDFKRMFTDHAKTKLNMTCKGFMSFINRSFLADPGQTAYGFKTIYGKRDKENLKKRKVAKKYKKATALFGEKQRILKNAYASDPGADLVFKRPVIQLHVEAVPDKPSDLGDGDDTMPPAKSLTILRIHIYDSQNTTYGCVQKLLEASNANSMGLLTKSAVGDAGDEHKAAFNTALEGAVRDGLLEKFPDDSSQKHAEGGDDTVADSPKQHYRLVGGFNALKSYIMKTVPSVRYGSQCSGVISANVSSQQNPQLASINMMRSPGADGADAQGTRDSGLPMRVSPTSLSIETFGCPLFNFGQQIFFDFGTGTTADNIYAVVGIDHTIGPGEFKTSVKLIQLDTWGKFESMIDTVDSVLTATSQPDKT